MLALLQIGNLSAEPPRGRLLASQCFQCHGTNGKAVGGFESISGKSANEMFEELREMSRRRSEGIMDLQASAYTEDQLLQISDYLATLPRGPDDDGGEDVEDRETREEAAKEDARIELVRAERETRKLRKREKRRARKKRARSKRRNRR